MVIWKYELAIVDTQVVRLPQGAKILSVANQRGTLCLWALVDPGGVTQDRTIAIVGTGNRASADVSAWQFVGTAVIKPFVWHVFEVKE